MRKQFEERLPFPLDDFQRRALDALDAGHSVLVAAPTGSGKTVVAEYAVASAVSAGRKAFYTTPIKALSNQKFRDLRAVYGSDRVGLLTGDNAINGDAPVVVMTTEVLRNMIYEGSSTLDALAAVVLDEVHYLQDPYRGAVWEEVIIHLDPAVRLVCLSATVSNAEEFGDWLGTVRGGTEVVIEERRPVELEHLYGVALRDVEELLVLPTFVREGRRARPNPKAAEFDPSGPPFGPRRGRRPPLGRVPRARPVAPRRADVAEELARRSMLPAICFIFSRAGCDDAVRQCLAARVRLGHSPERQRVREIAEAHCRGLSDADLEALGYGPWLAALEEGVAAHHAGMVPPMKEAVEEAFLAGLVKVVFATETLALGVNLPARSVVIEKLTKFTGERHEVLTPGEYTQLTGRAGRRGIDDIGYGLVLWSRFARFDQVAGLASKRSYELRSSFRPTYNMAVNLVRRYAPEEARHLLNLSFAQYGIDRDVVAVEHRIDDARQRVEAARVEVECELGDVVEYEGLVDALAAARRARAALQSGERARAAGQETRGTRSNLASLRPGDVVSAGGRIGRVVVVQRGAGRGGGARVTALDERGHTVRLGETGVREPPVVVGRVRLPEPYRPKSAAFRREAVARLRRAEIRTPAQSGATARRRAGDENKVAEIEAKLARHPIAECPALARHLDALSRARRLEREVTRAQARAGGRGDTLSRRFDQVLDVLGRRGYVEGWSLTPAGEMLSRIYSETDLLVAEAIREGVLAGLKPAEVAAVASLFTFEARGPEVPAPARWPTSAVAQRGRAVSALWRSIRGDEAAAGLPEMRSPQAGFVEAAYAWAAGDELDEVLEEEELTGGDFV
ncbi:MAG: DEAD/DEAH box helicase, partial [Actinobacteria bacterium]|nr:DEAD/DEAH box helicase [Actinomycetota bacterium]